MRVWRCCLIHRCSVHTRLISPPSPCLSALAAAGNTGYMTATSYLLPLNPLQQEPAAPPSLGRRQSRRRPCLTRRRVLTGGLCTVRVHTQGGQPMRVLCTASPAYTTRAWSEPATMRQFAPLTASRRHSQRKKGGGNQKNKYYFFKKRTPAWPNANAPGRSAGRPAGLFAYRQVPAGGRGQQGPSQKARPVTSPACVEGTALQPAAAGITRMARVCCWRTEYRADARPRRGR